MNIRCAIIDDEYLAREYLKDYVSKVPFLEMIGDYNSPLKVIDKVKRGEIDLLFLDIQMPDITGLDFLKTLRDAPHVIITTAFKEYALDGFELNVSDYLLKPFAFERFLTAVNKVYNLMENEQNPTLAHPHPASSETKIHDEYLVIKADRKLYKINYEDLIYMEGQKAYVSFYSKEKRITALASLRDLEEKLPGGEFIRIHKSFIVSIKSISALEGNMLEIAGKQLPVGKSYKKDLERIFGVE